MIVAIPQAEACVEQDDVTVQPITQGEHVLYIGTIQRETG